MRSIGQLQRVQWLASTVPWPPLIPQLRSIEMCAPYLLGHAHVFSWSMRQPSSMMNGTGLPPHELILLHH